MTDPMKNFAISTVSIPPSPATTGTTLSVSNVSLFPDPTDGDFDLTVWPSGVEPLASNAEIVTVTHLTDSQFTVTRHQQSTSAIAIQAGYQIEQGVTAGLLQGGSSPVTDDVFQFEEQPGDGQSFPVVAVSQGDGTFSVAGDHTDVLFMPGGNVVISGSTGNDGEYDTLSATYDSGSNRTIVTTDTDIPDGTVDGTLTAPVIYTATVVLGANTAVEWVFVQTTVPYDSDAAYMQIGDESSPAAFFAANGPAPSGDPVSQDVGSQAIFWQWPVLTLIDANLSPSGAEVIEGINPGYTLYPDGQTITIKLAITNPGSAGRTTVVVHHHDTEPGTPPVRNPAL